jgi:vacuolar protein sorting-associated protein IST1
LVSLYLTEIAKAYNVPFSELDKSNDDDDDDAEGGVKQPVNEKIEPQVIAEVGEFPDPSAPPKSPISVVAPPPTTDNPHPTLKINTQTKFTTPQTPTKPNSEDKKLNDLDELTKRFEALRKR